MFSFFFVAVAEGAKGPSSGFEVIGRELAELDEGRSQEAMDNFFAQSHCTDSPQTKLFYSAHYVRFIY